MKLRLLMMISFSVLFIIFIGVELVHSGERVTCEDGEDFLVNDEGVIESAIPLVQNEKIVVDTRSCRLTYYRDGREVKSYPVAIGTRKTPSPIGEWKIIHKGGSWGGGFGARWMGINVPWATSLLEYTKNTYISAYNLADNYLPLYFV